VDFVEKLAVIATNENGAVLNIATVASCGGLAIWFLFWSKRPLKGGKHKQESEFDFRDCTRGFRGLPKFGKDTN
jgi:hypothetical protein